MSVTVRLTDEVDVSRGDMICRPHNQPTVSQDIDAMICWMDDAPLNVGQKYVIKHTTRSVRALVKDVQYELDINTLHRTQDVASPRAELDRPGADEDDRSAADRSVSPQSADGSPSSSSTK